MTDRRHDEKLDEKLASEASAAGGAKDAAGDARGQDDRSTSQPASPSLRTVHLIGELSHLEGYVSTAVEREVVREDILRSLRRIRALAGLPNREQDAKAEGRDP